MHVVNFIEANPQVYVETPLHPEKLTVWCALWAGGIIGPYFSKNDESHNVTVNGDQYRAMITIFFIPELNNHDVQELWFQHDGATCHTARATIDILKDTFGDRLISRFGPVNWPPRSCDLTPLDYFLWGYVKSLVYADEPQTLDHLEDNLRRVIADIRPQMLEKVIENLTSRLDYILANRGSQMPEIIFKIISGKEIARRIAVKLATGRPISRFTVARRLHVCGLFARRPVRCVPLTPAHRRRYSLWWWEHRNWRDNEWGRVLFTDESRFSMSSDSHRILIWRERGSRNHPSNIIERDRYGGRGVLVWGGIMLGSRTDLHIFDAGSVNGIHYCNKILLPYVRLFRGAMGLQFLFIDDNALCHRTVAAEQLLVNESIERMDWPARSPDLNPFEHVWDFLGRRLAARTLPPVMIRELRLALQDE
ncbi:transposable element Tcb1 transposase [Trichonephila clavipes]|nr:transposable element Tcb1 transposase [Trichonephila clavipes]